MNKIIEDLNWRYATKKFDASKKISEADLDTLKETLRLTATSYGLQAMKVLLVESESLREELTAASYGQLQVKDASHLFVLCAFTEVSKDDIEDYMNLISSIRNVDRPNLDGFSNMLSNTVLSWTKEEQTKWSAKQTYIALGKLLHSCASLRIDSTPMEGFDASRVNEILNLDSKNLTATLMCPVGYRHDDDQAQYTPKVRKPLNHLIETIQ